MGLHTADSFRRSNMKGTMNDGTYSPDYSLASVDLKSFKNNLVDIIQQNKERWKELAAQGMVVYAPTAFSLYRTSSEILDVFIKCAHPWWYLEFSYLLITRKKVGFICVKKKRFCSVYATRTAEVCVSGWQWSGYEGWDNKMATNFIWRNNLLFISRGTFEPVFWGFASGFCVVLGMQHLVSEIWMSGLFVCLFFSILLR